MSILYSLCLGVLSSIVAVQAGGQAPAGGATTVIDDRHTAFGRALANLDPLRWAEFRAGRKRFVSQWTHRERWADATSCSECHFRDGRGPAPTQISRSHLLRLRQPSGSGDPIYGIQLRRTGLGVPAPGQFAVQWKEVVGRYPSGEPYALRRPRVRVSDLAYGPLDSRTRLALRVPLAVFGLGLLEGVSEQEILKFADPGDEDRDGVSGRAQRVRDPTTGSIVLGRFGWKASQSSLAAQSTAALGNDLGVTNASESELRTLVGYLRALAVPAHRRSPEPTVREGETLFVEIGCADCHRPRLTTGVVPGWPELSNQAIGAYTDLLLHDMGADLADDIGEAEASGREWRTPPLWGLGLVQTVGGQVGLLHDGRAASAEEAILWHDGEAARARGRFLTMPRPKREALIAFLSSL
jgi:CxxC motif-containing protein (DUF1111 family)